MINTIIVTCADYSLLPPPWYASNYLTRAYCRAIDPRRCVMVLSTTAPQQMLFPARKPLQDILVLMVETVQHHTHLPTVSTTTTTNTTTTTTVITTHSYQAKIISNCCRYDDHLLADATKQTRTVELTGLTTTGSMGSVQILHQQVLSILVNTSTIMCTHACLVPEAKKNISEKQ